MCRAVVLAGSAERDLGVVLQPGVNGDPAAYPKPVPGPAGPHAADPYSAVPSPELPAKRIGRGLALSLVAISAAMLLTAVIWRLGFIASVSAFVLAALR